MTADADLFNWVIQRIYTAGMLLAQAANRSTPAAAGAIEQAIAELDATVHDIRAATFGALAAGRKDPASGPSDNLEGVMRSLDETAAAIALLMAGAAEDGARSIDLLDAAYSVQRARSHVRGALSDRPTFAARREGAGAHCPQTRRTARTAAE